MSCFSGFTLLYSFRFRNNRRWMIVKTNVIRSRLAYLSMSQKDLADRLGISKNTMSSRMTGRSSFTVEEMDQICDILGFDKVTEAKSIFLG